MTAAQIAQSFSVQTEATNSYAYLANPNVASVSTFLTSVYANLFNRAPDAAGLTYWTNEINSGRSNVGNAIINIISGAQDNATTGNLDLTTVTNKMTAGLAWAQAMANVNGAVYNSAAAASAAGVVAGVTSAASTVTAAATSTASFFANGGAVTPTVTTLGTGVDTVTGSSNNTVNATDIGSTPAQSWSALDSISFTGSNNTLNVATALDISGAPTGATVSGVQTMNVTQTGSAKVVTLDSTGFTGLTKLNVTNSSTGNDTLTAAATTGVTNTGSSTGAVYVYGGNSVTVSSAGGNVEIGSAVTSTKANAVGAVAVTETSAGTATIKVDGGSSVNITETGAATGGVITVGANTKATGPVTVSATTASGGTNSTGAVTVNGGTSVSVNLASANTSGAATDTFGTVTVNGTTATTSVSVNEQAAATAAAAVTAVAGVVAVTGVSAAPGTNKVTAVTGVNYVKGSAVVPGVADGTVTIVDKVATAGSDTASTVAGGTISTVTLANGGATQVNSPALTTINVSGAPGLITTYEGGTLGSTNTTLTINASSLTGGNGLTDHTNQYTTLNVVTGALASGSSTQNLGAVTDTALTTVNVSGSSVLQASFGTDPTTITVTGAAGFNGSVTDTATTFDGSASSGADTVTIGADATKSIKGSSGTADEIILSAIGSTYTAAKTGAKVTGFEILGSSYLAASSTIDASVFSGISSFKVEAGIGAGNTLTVNKLAQNSAITTTNDAGTEVFTYVDNMGMTDSVTITLGSSSNSSALTVNALTVADANGFGIGTINIVSNDVTPSSNAGSNGQNVITTLTDGTSTTWLTNLNISGSGGLSIGSAISDSAASLTINNTETNTEPLTLAGISDNSLGNLVFSGTNNTTITALTDTAAVVSISNTGTGIGTIAGWTSSATSLTLSGALNITTTASSLTSLSLVDKQTIALTDANTSGVTISGASDNSHVTVNLSAGAASGNTDTVTLGNANNSITDASTAGTVNITVGTGSNLIDLHGSGAAGYSASINLGSHSSTTGVDKILVAKVAVGATSANTTITGAVTGDLIKFTDNGTTVTTLTSPQLTAVAAQSTLAAAISYVDGTGATGTALQAHNAVAFGWGGNTYVLETAANGTGTLTANDGLIQITGTHTLSSTVSSNVFSLAS